MAHILMVCTGNICRSPSAEALLRHRLAQAGLDDWHVASAGTWGLKGHAASQHAVAVLAERGIDLTGHRARKITRAMVEWAGLVLVMTQAHAEALRLDFPDQADKIYLLSEMKDGRRYDIQDPYGGPREAYRVCIDELTDLIDGGFARIRALASPEEKD